MKEWTRTALHALHIAIAAALALPTLALADGQPSREEIKQSLAKRHDALMIHSQNVSVEIHKAHAGRYRLFGGLLACEMKGLAEAVKPSQALMEEKIREYVSRVEEARPYAVEIDAAVRSSIMMLIVGEQDSAALILGSISESERSALCDALTKLANDQLLKDAVGGSAE